MVKSSARKTKTPRDKSVPWFEAIVPSGPLFRGEQRFRDDLAAERLAKRVARHDAAKPKQKRGHHWRSDISAEVRQARVRKKVQGEG